MGRTRIDAIDIIDVQGEGGKLFKGRSHGNVNYTVDHILMPGEYEPMWEIVLKDSTRIITTGPLSIMVAGSQTKERKRLNTWVGPFPCKKCKGSGIEDMEGAK
jgi:hypothetical protein